MAYFTINNPIFSGGIAASLSRIASVIVANSPESDDAKHFFPLITNTGPYKIDLHKREFPNATYCTEHVLCLPIYPDLTREEQDYIIDNLLEAVNKI